MSRLGHLVITVVLALILMLPQLGSPDEKSGKNKEDALIAGMKFVKVPKGTFWMGWAEIAKDGPKQVEIKADFELAAFTVTQEQWIVVMDKNPSCFSRHGTNKNRVAEIADADLMRFPVETVSWNDVQEFLKNLNAMQKGNGWLYRLPSEAEWEYACRNAAKTKKECSFEYYLDEPGDFISGRQANVIQEVPKGIDPKALGRPATVGSYAPNKLGLYDMHGNVRQWCADLEGSDRVVRGSSCSLLGRFCGAARRYSHAPSDRFPDLGFRLVRVPAETKK